MDDQSSLSIEELAERGGVPVRTVRFYISEGLLPRPEGRGKGGWYGREHLLRLRLARLLAERRVPLGEIRAQLGRLTLEEVRALLAEEEGRATAMARVEPTGSPREYVSALLERARAGRPRAAEVVPSYSEPAALSGPPSMPAPAASGPAQEPRPPPAPSRTGVRDETWRRIELAPGVELHVRSDVEARHVVNARRWASIGTTPSSTSRRSTRRPAKCGNRTETFSNEPPACCLRDEATGKVYRRSPDRITKSVPEPTPFTHVCTVVGEPPMLGAYSALR